MNRNSDYNDPLRVDISLHKLNQTYQILVKDGFTIYLQNKM